MTARLIVSKSQGTTLAKIAKETGVVTEMVVKGITFRFFPDGHRNEPEEAKDFDL